MELFFYKDLVTNVLNPKFNVPHYYLNDLFVIKIIVKQPLKSQSMFNSILVQASGVGQFGPLLMIGGMFIIMYFFMMRPQQKKAKEQQAYVDGLKAGEKVVTIGGVHGTIVTVRDKTVLVEVDSSKGVRMTFLKSAISKDATSQLGAE